MLQAGAMMDSFDIMFAVNKYAKSLRIKAHRGTKWGSSEYKARDEAARAAVLEVASIAMNGGTLATVKAAISASAKGHINNKRSIKAHASNFICGSSNYNEVNIINTTSNNDVDDDNVDDVDDNWEDTTEDECDEPVVNIMAHASDYIRSTSNGNYNNVNNLSAAAVSSVYMASAPPTFEFGGGSAAVVGATASSASFISFKATVATGRRCDDSKYTYLYEEQKPTAHIPAYKFIDEYTDNSNIMAHASNIKCSSSNYNDVKYNTDGDNIDNDISELYENSNAKHFGVVNTHVSVGDTCLISGAVVSDAYIHVCCINDVDTHGEYCMDIDSYLHVQVDHVGIKGRRWEYRRREAITVHRQSYLISDTFKFNWDQSRKQVVSNIIRDSVMSYEFALTSAIDHILLPKREDTDSRKRARKKHIYLHWLH